ncbi:hypothetical protein ECFRIK523_5765, partial [Escherichia coli FRIK523]
TYRIGTKVLPLYYRGLQGR